MNRGEGVHDRERGEVSKGGGLCRKKGLHHGGEGRLNRGTKY